MWLSKASSPEKRGAAWQWIKFLVSKDSQVLWHTRKGAVPTRISVAEDPAVQALWAQNPAYRVGYDQLQGAVDDATAGSLIGPYQEVRDAITNGIASMVGGDAHGRRGAREGAVRRRRGDRRLQLPHRRLTRPEACPTEGARSGVGRHVRERVGPVASDLVGIHTGAPLAM